MEAFLTFPFLIFNLQFIASDKVVFKEIELFLKEADDKKKLKNKLSLANTEKRREYEEIYLRMTIKILLINSINRIKRCLVRSAAKKTFHTLLLEGFLSFPPVRQVVLNNQLLFREAVKQCLEQQEQQQE